MYTFSEVDAVYTCGDLNSRIVGLEDCINDVDDATPRANLDTVLNKHGEILLEFLKDSKCCILNGRISPGKDHFTSISTKGKAVVDYVITHHECFESNFLLLMSWRKVWQLTVSLYLGIASEYLTTLLSMTFQARVQSFLSVCNYIQLKSEVYIHLGWSH